MLETGAHILVFPYPAQGHTIPILHLTHRLAARGLTVTVLVTPKNLPSLNPLLAAHPSSVSALVLPFPPNAAVPDGVENTFDLPDGGFRPMMFALGGLRDPLLRWFRRHPSPPAAIVSDMFLGWTHHLARQLGIRRYVFCPSGAFAVSVINSLWVEMPRRKNEGDVNETVSFPGIPSCPVYPWWQLSPIYRSYVEGDPVSEFLKDSLLANISSYGLIFNTFRELEGVYLDHLMKELGHDRVWSVGPVLPPTNMGLNPIESAGFSSTLAGEIRSWLDTCLDHTVVYVCFGSQAVLTDMQMEQLTLGLEKSGVQFILVLKGLSKVHEGGDYGAIPLGFEDRVAGRGIVINGWAPQVEILSHRAVCAFFTHCGWNSVLESIVAGVPMMAWPMSADQFVDATLLVDQLSIAIRVCEEDESVLDSDELALFLVEATSEKWREIRDRAVAMSKAAIDATKESGSSFNNLDGLMRELTEKCGV